MTDLAQARGGRLRALGGGLAAGLILAGAAPPLDQPLLVFAGLLPLYYALFGPGAGDKPRALLGGYACGTVYFFFHLNWLLKLSKEEVTIPWIMIPALIVLALYFALFQAIPFWLASRVRRRRGWSPIWTVPFLWVAFDALKASGEIAFSWGSLGYSLAPLTPALQMTSWAGYWVLPLWILFVTGGLFALMTGWRRPVRPLAALAALSVPVIGGAIVLAGAPDSVSVVPTSRTNPEAAVESQGGTTVRGTPGHPVRFGLIQANTPREIKWDPDYRRLVTQDLVAKTDEISSRDEPDLVIWPETAAPLRVLWVQELRDLVTAGVRRSGRWTLVGSLDATKVADGYEHYNSAILFDPEGNPNAKYNKRRMVPFGEFTPWLNVVPWLARLDFGQSEFTPGRQPGQFRIEGVGRFSCLICFESTFPGLARRDVADGARFLVNITNDFWFGPGAGPNQAARFAILRAVENRTPLIRCANSGLTFVVDPYGRVHGTTGLFETVLRSYDVAPGQGPSFHTRTGDWILWLASVVALVLAGAGIGSGYAGRRRDGTANDGTANNGTTNYGPTRGGARPENGVET